MHGLVNRSIECFIKDNYGAAAWSGILDAARLDVGTFEAMLCYDDDLTDGVLAAASEHLGKPRDELLEDLGTYLIANRRDERLRRLLRFAGETFEEFLLSVDELPDRARLALPDLWVPSISIASIGPNSFEICAGPGIPGFGHVLAGVLRAMADDYGALVMLGARVTTEDGASCIHVTLYEARHSEGRSFVLATPP